jgi:hypothetical protein
LPMTILEAVAPSREVVFMLENPTISRLKELKLKTMASMLSDPVHSLLELSFEERFSLMVEREWISRKNNKIKRLLHTANLSQNACLEDIRYSDDRSIDKKTIQTLSTGTYIHQYLNVIISGKTGSGKSFLACALGNSACRQQPVLFDREYILQQHHRFGNVSFDLEQALVSICSMLDDRIAEYPNGSRNVFSMLKVIIDGPLFLIFHKFL